NGPTITTKDRPFEVALCGIDADIYSAKDFGRENSAYIAAANPQTILTLIERLETLEAERKGTVRLTLEQARAIEAMPGVASTTMQITCPVCGAWRWNHPAENMRHAPDCWLTAAIKDATK